MDKMFGEEDFATEDDAQELVTLVVVSENQEQKLPTKPQIQFSIITF